MVTVGAGAVAVNYILGVVIGPLFMGVTFPWTLHVYFLVSATVWAWLCLTGSSLLESDFSPSKDAKSW